MTDIREEIKSRVAELVKEHNNKFGRPKTKSDITKDIFNHIWNVQALRSTYETTTNKTALPTSY